MRRSVGIHPRKLFLYMWVPSTLVLAGALIEGAWLAGWRILNQAFALVTMAFGLHLIAGWMILSIVLPKSEEEA